MPNVLILGGTSEASALALELAAHGIAATLSYAGRTAAPRAQPVPVRIGGFGGAAGLTAHLAATGVTHVVDATHPFAAQISANAVAAATAADVPLLALVRPPWRAQAGDAWRHVSDIDAAVAALGGPPRRILLAIGRMHVDRFAGQPQHHYLLRFVDPPAARVALPDHAIVVDRGPFTVAGDIALLRARGIDLVVAKNAGGSGASAKVAAARALGLPMLMIDPPPAPAGRAEVRHVADVLAWLGHAAHRGV